MSGPDTPNLSQVDTAVQPAGSARPDVLDVLYPNDKPAASDDAIKRVDTAAAQPGEKPSDKPAEQAAAPDAYQLAAPEGFEISADMAAEVTPVFKEIGLTNDHANKLMPLAAKLVDRIETGHADAFRALKADWARETKADAEIGGERLSDTLRLANKAVAAAAGPQAADLRRYLDETGLGNHPGLIRVFRYFGAMLEKGTQPRTREDALYPNTSGSMA